MSSICLIMTPCPECDLMCGSLIYIRCNEGLGLYEMLNKVITRPLLALVSNLITSTLFGIKFNISGKSEKSLASLTTNC